MTNNNKIKKNILKSPIDSLSEHKIQLSKDEHLLFEKLVSQQQALKKQHSLKLEQRKFHSKEVGNAKKLAQDIEPLIQLIKAISADIDQLNQQIKQVELAIFIYFDTPVSNNTMSPKNEHIEVGLVEDFSYSNLNIRLLDSRTAYLSAFLEKNNNTSIYHKFEWISLINKTFGHKGYYFIAETDQKEVLGVLPLIRLKSKLFGDFLISMPYFNYGGAVAIDNKIEKLLIKVADQLAHQLDVSHIEYRDNKKRDGLPVKADKVNMILKLEATKVKMLSSFPAKLRSQIKKSQNEGFETKSGGIDLLDDFYGVFARNMRDLGTPVYDKLFFKNILITFQKYAKIMVIYHKGKAVSTAFLLKHKAQLEIPWASTLKEYNQLNANMFLYWQVIQYAIEANCQTFDFGRSSLESGTYRFKKQWGAKPTKSYWHYWLSEGVDMPALNPNNPKFKLAISIWQKMPVFLTNLVGPHIVKNLP